MRTINRRRELGLASAAGAALLGSLAGACGPAGTGPAAVHEAAGGSSGAGSRRLRIGVSFEVLNLSPHDNGFWLTSYGTGQSLYRVTPEDTLVPWIATSITAEGQDGYTIKLDPRAKFHNGKPIDARMVQGSIERHLAAGVRSVPSLRGARWESPDPQTLRVRTAEPDPWLPNTLALAYLPIFDVAEVPPKEELTGDVLNALVGRGFYSGPFRVTRLTPQEMLLDSVPDAWDGAPRLAGVDVRFIKDPLARLAALKTGEIDLMLYVPADAVPQIKQTGGLHFKVNSSGGRWRLIMNHARPPFDQLPVRQAVALGIDRKQMAEQVMNGSHQAPDTLYPQAMPWVVPGILRTDLAEARRLLDGAGWRPGPDGVRVKDGKRLAFELLHYPQQPDSKTMGEALQAQLRGLGMEVRLKQVDDLTSTLRAKEFDAALPSGSMQQAGNPVTVLNSVFASDGRDNFGGWGSPELDGLIRRLNVEFDSGRRNDLLKQVQELMRRDAPITWVTSRPWAVAVNDAFASYVPGVDVDHYIVRKDVAPAAQAADKR